MYSSSSVSKRIILTPFLAVLAIHFLPIRNVVSLNMTNAYLQHKCYANQGKYKPGSVYDKLLKSIIDSVTSTGHFHRGYDMMTLSEGLDFASLIFQCRGDSYGPKCRSCYTTALSAVRKRCPRNKGGIIWYDQCFLEISGIDSIGKIDYENNFCTFNAKNVTGDTGTFNINIMTLLANLTSTATSEKNLDGHQHARYAAGERRLETKKLYGMVQCTKDISIKACQVCLGYISLHFHDCFGGKQGARVFGRSCNFRFEFYPFVTTKSGPKYLDD